KADCDDGIGSDLDLPGTQGRQTVSPTGARDVRRPAMVDVPDGRGRTHVRADPPFPASGKGAGALCDRALLERDAATIRRAERAPEGSRVPGRWLFHRRHRDLPMGRAL